MPRTPLLLTALLAAAFLASPASATVITFVFDTVCTDCATAIDQDAGNGSGTTAPTPVSWSFTAEGDLAQGMDGTFGFPGEFTLQSFSYGGSALIQSFEVFDASASGGLGIVSGDFGAGTLELAPGAGPFTITGTGGVACTMLGETFLGADSCGVYEADIGQVISYELDINPQGSNLPLWTFTLTCDADGAPCSNRITADIGPTEGLTTITATFNTGPTNPGTAPEPATLWLVVPGLLALAGRRRSKRRG